MHICPDTKFCPVARVDLPGYFPDTIRRPAWPHGPVNISGVGVKLRCCLWGLESLGEVRQSHLSIGFLRYHEETVDPKDFIGFWMDFMGFHLILGGFGQGFGSQVGTMLATKTPPRRPKTRPRRPTKLSRRPKDTKTPSRGSKTPPRPPKIPPRPLKTAPGSAQEPPEVLINWRGGTKAQPSSIRRRSAERRARWRAVQLLAKAYIPSP